MKKFFRYVIFIGVIILFSDNMHAQVSQWDGTATIWTQGSGTVNDPFQIENAQHLAYLANEVNNGISYVDNYFLLTTDIDLQNLSWQPIGGNWNAYGYSSHRFRGHFDGGNHLIYNMNVFDSRYCGLFGVVGEAIIHHVRVDGMFHTTLPSGAAAGIVALVYNTTASTPTYIHHCQNSGTVITQNTSQSSSWSMSGGIIGMIWSCPSLIVTNCYNSGNILAEGGSTQFAGGIVAGNIDDSKINILHCHNTGSVGIPSGYVVVSCLGGIIGNYSTSVGDTSMFFKCSNAGRLYSGQEISAGGILGRLDNSNDGYFEIEQCCNMGNLDLGNLDMTNAALGGGIVASFNTQDNFYGIVRNCYNTGNLSGNYVAGISCFTGSNLTIKNCYNAGNLTGYNRGAIKTSGNSTVSNCFYLNTCGSTTGGGTSLIDSYMQSNEFPPLLNTDSTVFVMAPSPTVNHGYPIFGTIDTSIITLPASGVLQTAALLHGYCNVTADLTGFQYKRNEESSFTTIYTPFSTLFDQSLTSLASNSIYQYRAFAQINGCIYYGQVESFQTMPCESIYASIHASETEICEGNSATLTVVFDSASTSNYTYLWNTGETTASIVVADNNEYIVTISESTGCSISDTITLTQWPSVQNDIYISTEEPCYTWNDVTYCSSGNYTQILETIHGCDSVVTLHLTIPTAIEDHIVFKNIKAYPNPAHDFIVLECNSGIENDECIEIVLTDTYGRILQQKRMSMEKTGIDISSYSSGLYLVTIYGNGQPYTILKLLKY